MPEIDYVIYEDDSELDARYLEHADLGDEPWSVLCRAFDGDSEVGALLVDGAGVISGVSVEVPYRRLGIATGMLLAVRKAGYQASHSDNLRPDGAAWVTALDGGDDA